MLEITRFLECFATFMFFPDDLQISLLVLLASYLQELLTLLRRPPHASWGSSDFLQETDVKKGFRIFTLLQIREKKIKKRCGGGIMQERTFAIVIAPAAEE